MVTDNISLAPVTQENWRAALRLAERGAGVLAHHALHGDDAVGLRLARGVVPYARLLRPRVYAGDCGAPAGNLDDLAGGAVEGGERRRSHVCLTAGDGQALHDGQLKGGGGPGLAFECAHVGITQDRACALQRAPVSPAKDVVAVSGERVTETAPRGEKAHGIDRPCPGMPPAAGRRRRSCALDKPALRQPRIAALRTLAAGPVQSPT